MGMGYKFNLYSWNTKSTMITTEFQQSVRSLNTDSLVINSQNIAFVSYTFKGYQIFIGKINEESGTYTIDWN